MPFTAADIARQLQATVSGKDDVVLTGFAPADSARNGDLTFAENATFFQRAIESAASAVLVDTIYSQSDKTLIQVPNARIAFAKVLPLFFPEKHYPAGVHPSAVIHPSAEVHPEAHVGPHCVVEAGGRIGQGTTLISGVFVGENSKIGADCRFFPNVAIYHNCTIGARVRIHAGSVIGSDGFGYVFDQGEHRKVPQIGTVIIEDDVEIGANVTIDRGALGPTRIGRGSKLDNLVQIAHNVTLGDHCIIVAQGGIAGSASLGSYVTLAGQSGIAGHLKIGSRVVIAGQSGVMHNIPDGEKWFGSPAQPDRETKRQLIAIQRLPDLIKRVNALEKSAPQRDPNKPDHE